MSYRQFKVIEKDGRVTATEAIRPEKTPAWARNVSQNKHDWSSGPDMTKPYFKTPIPFVLPPVDEGEPFHGHNHCPALTWCPNGDLLAIWFSTHEEVGLEMTILASRLRAGADEWEPASEFFKGAQRNMTGSALLHDGKGKLSHINGMGPENVRHWQKLAMLLRTSTDNGRTWTPARPISSGSKYTLRHQPIAGTFMTKAGAIIQACDATWSMEGPTAIHISRDGGKTWTDPGGHIRGIHARIVELKDGRLMAFGRGQAIDGKMPMSLSADMGKTWTHKASPFPPIGGGQRLILKRLREGSLLFVSFTSTKRSKPEANGMTFTDQKGREFTGHGMYAAVSFDDGETWPVRKLLTPGEGTFNGGAWTQDFTATPTRAEHAGYLAATQTPDGVIHLISSRLHYRFNLAWLKSGNPAAEPPHPATNSESPVMLSGAWLPEDTHRLDFQALPRVPSEHVVISDVRAKGSSPEKLDKKAGGVNQHNYLAFHNGQFWAMWSDGPGIEDRVGQVVKYATSDDGLKWSEPQLLTPFPLKSGPDSPHYNTRSNKGMRWIARGFWKREGKMLALASLDEAAGFFGPSLELRAFRFNKTRDAWEDAGLIYKDAINNFPPKKLRTGEWLMSRRPHNYYKTGVHFLVGGVKAIDDWKSFPVFGTATELKAEEPGWWILPDNSLSAIFRDNQRSGYIYRSFSTDDGRTWSKPVRTNFPDATSKMRGVRLRDGRYVLVSNSNPKGRNPLTLAISPDGLVFTKLMVLVDAPRIGYGWIDYPDVMEHEDSLYIAFAGNKGSVNVLKVKLADMDAMSMPSSPQPVQKAAGALALGSFNDMVAKTLIVSEAEKERLRKLEAKGLVTVKPVALPTGRYLKGRNNHLGWPVGIKVGKTLLCAYHQTLRHHGGGPRQDASSSDAVIVRSTDGGKTWSGPIDIRHFGTSEKAMVLNFGNCFGVLKKKVFLATRYGLYRSGDEGKTWTLVPDALTQDQTGHKYKDNFGPRMIIHPKKGLVIPVGVERSPCIDMYNSKDEGLTWQHERFQLSNRIHPLEPTAIYHEGHLIFLTRNHTLPFKWHKQLKETQRPAMMVSNTGWFPMRHQNLTNISSYRWPDTSDVEFNPVTKRFEAVVTNRSGGVGENEENEQHEQTVSLWSLSKEDMVTGRADKWRFEGILLRLKAGMLNHGPGDIDAAHPGGAVMDEENGLQHIFFYCGRYSTPAGIYRITRTLDTDKLRKAMRQQGAEATNPESPTMLSGAWLPENPHRLDFQLLPWVPSKHVVISDVRAKGSSPKELNHKDGGVNQHNYLAFHDGRFWAMWSDGPGIEDRVGQCVKYATSNDGLKWSKPQLLTPFPPNSGPDVSLYNTRSKKGMRWISRGYWKREGEPLALASLDEAAGFFGSGLELRAFRFNKSRDAWEDAGLVSKNTINNFPPENVEFTPEHRVDFLGGVTVLKGKALTFEGAEQFAKDNPGAEVALATEDGTLYQPIQPRDFTTPTEGTVELSLIPYYAWANRGIAYMDVWMPLATQDQLAAQRSVARKIQQRIAAKK